MTKPAKSGKLTAAELIAKAQKPNAVVPPELLKELKALCDHNDKAGRARLGRTAAQELCKSHGLPIGHIGLDKLCQQFGRKSYAQK